MYNYMQNKQLPVNRQFMYIMYNEMCNIYLQQWVSALHQASRVRHKPVAHAQILSFFVPPQGAITCALFIAFTHGFSSSVSIVPCDHSFPPITTIARVFRAQVNPGAPPLLGRARVRARSILLRPERALFGRLGDPGDPKRVCALVVLIAV